MEVFRLVETHVTYFVQSFSAPALAPLVDSSPPLVSVDLLLTWLAARIASTRHVLAIVWAQRVGRVRRRACEGFVVELGQAMAGFVP